MVDELHPHKAISDIVDISVEEGSEDLPCLSCQDYTFYGCCRSKHCEAFIKWKEQNHQK
ncbi:MAG: hypothetical protein BAJATHORv1_30268 [Candidatus Thorarchaeota archaeon]|nr:MAG: hypothetical protein BAJATHORv1_30268 [Candidatus Thorarchaeota archaeon]